MIAKPTDEKQEPAFKPEPGAWERFEKAMDKVVKAPPRHRAARKGKGKDEDHHSECVNQSLSSTDKIA